ncbi:MULTISPECIES: chaperone NapD [Deefgea]|nr:MULTISPECIES: chaperone NapD [Deefgea]MBM9888918.1 chaperone NapD [Deefgea sp. CFH1-16]
MNIYSLVIRAVPGHYDEVRAAILAQPGVEIHIEHEGKIIATVEDVPGLRGSDVLKNIQEISHVASATLAYEYSDDETQPPKELATQKTAKEHLS